MNTTDFKRVLIVAVNVKPDYVVADSTDEAVETRAYVSEKLGLPGYSLDSIRLLTYID